MTEINKKLIVTIPARLAATRLPNKPLADIHGRPMIVHVWERVVAAIGSIDQVIVAAGDAEIVDVMQSAGGRVVLTDQDLPSGSDRVFRAIQEIEKLNILNASLLAMKRSIKKLKSKPSLIMIDGNKLPIMNGYKLKSIVKGDQKVPEISAASIIAKVSRDRLISKMSKKFVKYGWNKNSGYGTKQHLKAIKKFGVTKHHRKTFDPIHNILSLKKIS